MSIDGADLQHHGLHHHALSGCGEIRDRDRPARHLRHRRAQQEMVRLACRRTCSRSSTETPPRNRWRSIRRRSISTPRRGKDWIAGGGELISSAAGRAIGDAQIRWQASAKMSRKKSQSFSAAYQIVISEAAQTDPLGAAVDHTECADREMLLPRSGISDATIELDARRQDRLKEGMRLWRCRSAAVAGALRVLRCARRGTRKTRPT